MIGVSLDKEGYMNKAQMNKKIAYLEFVQDQLETELTELDSLLRSVGFPEGLASVKAVAQELLANGDLEDAA